MDKAIFLEIEEENLQNLLISDFFHNEIGQIRAKALGGKFDEKYDEERILSENFFLLSSGVKLLLNSEEEVPLYIAALKQAAETFEFLSKIGEKIDKFKCLLNAALAYHIAGYDANSRYLAKNIGSIEINGEISHKLYNYWLKSIITFLQRNLKILQINSELAESCLIREQINVPQEYNIEDWTFEISAYMQFHDAMKSFVNYCFTGDEEIFNESLTKLKKSTKLFRTLGDVEIANISYYLEISMMKLFKRSTWTILKENKDISNPFWHRYLSLLSGFPEGSENTDKPSVIEFWKSQKLALEGGLISKPQSYVIRMPTSSGKTRIAELAILNSLIEKIGTRCIYISPFKSLAYQIEEAMMSTIGDLGFIVSSVTGNYETDDLEDYLLNESDLLITTPEKLDMIYRSQPEFFNSVSLVIVDEGQIIDQSTRGLRLEFLIARIMRRIRKIGGNFLFLSAVMPEENMQEFALWLSKSKENLLQTDWRPTRQLLTLLNWNEKRGYGNQKFIFDRGKSYFVPKLIQRQKFLFRYETPTGRKKTKEVFFPEIVKENKNPKKNQIAVALAFKYVGDGSVIVFTTLPDFVNSLGKNFIYYISLHEENNIEIPKALISNQIPHSLDIAFEWFGENHIVSKCLNRGIGLHHGRLPSALRRAIEEDFRTGRLQVLICTNTLAQGVNLPAKRVIVHTVVRAQTDIPIRDFWNICGRAGRAGKETEGEIIFLNTKPGDFTKFKRFRNRDNIERADSVLLSILRSLIEKRISQEALQELLDPYILALLVEESVGTSDQDIVEEILENSLVKIQAISNDLDINPLVEGIIKVRQWIRKFPVDKELKKVFAKTGMKLNSCKKISDFISGQEWGKKNLILDDFLEKSLPILLDLHEMVIVKRSLMKYIPLITPTFIQDWINLTSIPELARKYLSDNKDTNLEGLANFIGAVVTFQFSWVLSGFLRILEYKLSMKDISLPLKLIYLPSMVKNGVNSPEACWGMSLGIPTRNLSNKIAHIYQAEEAQVNFKNYIKWFSEIIEEDIIEKTTLTLNEINSVMRIATRLNYDRTKVNLIRTRKLDSFTSNIRGIKYENRLNLVKKVNIGDDIELKRDIKNPYDPNAIKLFFKDMCIGFVQRDVARILAREMDLGTNYSSQISEIIVPTKTYPFPNLKINISKID